MSGRGAKWRSQLCSIPTEKTPNIPHDGADEYRIVSPVSGSMKPKAAVLWVIATSIASDLDNCVFARLLTTTPPLLYGFSNGKRSNLQCRWIFPSALPWEQDACSFRLWSCKKGCFGDMLHTFRVLVEQETLLDALEAWKCRQ